MSLPKSLTKADLADIRAIVRSEVAAVVKIELDEYAKQVGPVLADHVKFQSEQLRKDVKECLKVAAAEFKAELTAGLKAGLGRMSEAVAAGEREIFAAINTLKGMVGPLGPRLTGIEGRVKGLEERLDLVYQAQHTVIDQNASVRDALLGSEKAAVTEVPPAFDAEPKDKADPTDAPKATDAE